MRYGSAPLSAQVDQELHRRVAEAIHERLGERAWTAARNDGHAMAFGEAVAYVLEEAELPA